MFNDVPNVPLVFFSMATAVFSHYLAIYSLSLQLSSLEEDFIYAAEFGDIPTVRRVLEENANFSVDYSDILGRTPLRLAVGNEHLEVRSPHIGLTKLNRLYASSFVSPDVHNSDVYSPNNLLSGFFFI